jgi:phosphonate transport system substrate-binding protein
MNALSHVKTMRAVTPAIFCALLLWLGGARAESALAVHVVPQFPPAEIHRAWVPLLRRISEATGIQLVLQAHRTIPEFEQAFLKGVPDVVYLNPYHAVMARRAAGYEPIVRDLDQLLSGILVVRKDAPYHVVRDLSGKDIVFPAPNAFGASLYMRALLTERERIAYTSRYVGTHSNVFRLVIAGRAPAGGAIRQTLAKETPEVQGQLRVLYETPPSPPHPVAVHPRVPAKARETLRRAFIDLAEDPEGEALLRGVLIARPGATSYQEYLPLERLSLEKYIVPSAD